MAYRGIWVIWLIPVAAMFCGEARIARAQDSSIQQRVAARIPWDEIAEGARDRVRQVVQRPTLFGHGPTEAFTGDPTTYLWLLDHPDRAVDAWRKLGAKCSDISDLKNGTFAWTDGHGSEIHWQTVLASSTLRVWYAQGKIRPGVLLPPVPIHIVVLLRHGQRQGDSGKTFLYHQSYVFVQTDSKTAALAARMLGASVPKVTEQCLSQLEMFFSALVWYLDQHPEQLKNLLAISQTIVP